MEPIRLRTAALLVVDAQRGFTTLCPDELPVPGGLEIVPAVNRLLDRPWARIDADAYAVTAQHPGLPALLRAEGVETVVVCGIATNICCFFAARDLRRAGFDVSLVEDASAGLDVPAAGLYQAQAKAEGRGIGIRYVTVAEVVGV